jgi:hypothetical protein
MNDDSPLPRPLPIPTSNDRQLDFGWWQIYRCTRPSVDSVAWVRDPALTSDAHGYGFAGVVIAEPLNTVVGAPDTRPESKLGAVEHWIYTLEGLPDSKKLYRYELEYVKSDTPWAEIKVALNTIRNGANKSPVFQTVFSSCSEPQAVSANWFTT